MARKRSIIIYPHLNDGGGDLTKAWYVEWKYRVPGEPKIRKERIYKGLNQGTAEERYKLAKSIIKKKSEWLKSGKHLDSKSDKKVVYEDELLYRHEAKLYGKVKESVSTFRKHLSAYIKFKEQSVNKKTLDNIRSKLRMFGAWMGNRGLIDIDVKYIEKQHIIDFSIYLSKNENLAVLTIKKYIQILHSFFEWAEDQNLIDKNPAKKIPTMGKVVDESATPFALDERQRLKEAIEFKDPQLWLACEIQYYCAIRPGTELRLMKIGWIDFDRKRIRIPAEMAKSDRTDIVDVPEFLFKKLLPYQQYDRNLYLFGKNRMPNTEPVGMNTLRNRFNTYRDSLGISRDRKFYSWKHTGAIQLIDNEMHPYDLKNHLRHKSFTTTERYLKKHAGNLSGKIEKYSSEI